MAAMSPNVGGLGGAALRFPAGLEALPRGNPPLRALSPGLPALSQLALPSRHTVTDAGLAALCRLAGLLELDLTDYSHITNEGLQHLPQLSR